MRQRKIYNQLLDDKARGKKSIAILIDPDKATEEHLIKLIAVSEGNCIPYFFIGGSLITSVAFNSTIAFLKKNTSVPLLIFPGSNSHIDDRADAILFLSLISGRNPEFLIGQHVVAAPRLKDSLLEILSTAYILIDGGKPTTVSYISNTTPIPNDKPEIVASTALAGELMGMGLIYLDSGSGALTPVSAEIIKRTREWITSPIIVGGGIDNLSKVKACFDAGADVVVVGNAVEKDLRFVEELGNF